MKRRWTSFVIAAALLTTASAHAYNDPFCDLGRCISNGDLNVYVGTGWREDNLNYTFVEPNVVVVAASVGDVLTNVQYQGIRSWNVGGRAEYDTCGLVARVYGQYGAIYSGHSKYIEYVDGSEDSPLFQYNYQSDRGEVFDFGGAVGIPLASTIRCVNFVVTPLFGWSQSEQHFQQVIQEPVVDPRYVPSTLALVGSNIPKAYNSYQTRWNGVYTGYDLAIEVPCSDLTLWTGFEWHWPKFVARGQVNKDETPVINPADGTLVQTLPQQKIDITQKKWGNGWVLRFGGEWQVDHCWNVGLLAYYSRYSIGGGREDDVDVINNLTSAGSVADLTWISWSIMGNIGYSF